jgi:hypothetical protein
MAVYPTGVQRRQLNLPQEVCVAASKSGLSGLQGSLNAAQKSAEGIIGGIIPLKARTVRSGE